MKEVNRFLSKTEQIGSRYISILNAPCHDFRSGENAGINVCKDSFERSHAGFGYINEYFKIH